MPTHSKIRWYRKNLRKTYVKKLRKFSSQRKNYKPQMALQASFIKHLSKKIIPVLRKSFWNIAKEGTLLTTYDTTIILTRIVWERKIIGQSHSLTYMENPKQNSSYQNLCMKMLVFYCQVGFIPSMKGWFNIRQPIYVIFHIISLK